MINARSSQEDYQQVSIYKDFYYNKHLGLPTIIKEYSRLEKVLCENQYLSCITAQVAHLQKIEYQYGSDLYSKLLSHITSLLKKMKSSDFRDDDIFRLAAAYNDEYLPLKERSNLEDQGGALDISLDDISDLLGK